MKVFIKFLLLIVVLYMTIGCSEDNFSVSKSEVEESLDLTPNENRYVSEMLLGNKISMDDAISMLSDEKTRSSLSNIAVLTKRQFPNLVPRVATLLPDTLAYIFRNQEGDVVIPADKRVSASTLVRLEQAHLIDDNGQILQNDEVANTLFYIVNKIYEDISLFESSKDSIYRALQEKLNILCPNVESSTRAQANPQIGYGNDKYRFLEIDQPCSDWRDTYSILPLLYTRWSQREPYNNLVKDRIPGDSALAGCVAVAFAQVMAYWKFPAQYQQVVFDWDYISSIPDISQYDVVHSLQVATLIKEIGDGVAMKYEPGGSGAYLSDAVNWIRTQGYSCDNITDYSFAKVVSSLNSQCPVVADGWATKDKDQFIGITLKTHYKDGHTWVIDGYKKQERNRYHKIYAIDKKTEESTLILDDTYVEKLDFLHINWGGELGAGNGWYQEGCFNLTTPFALDSEATSSDDNFQYKNHIVTNLKRY